MRLCFSLRSKLRFSLRSKWKKLLLFGALAVIILFGGTAAYGIYMFHKIKTVADSMYEEIERTEPSKRETFAPVVLQENADKTPSEVIFLRISEIFPAPPAPQPIGILLLGVDERSGDRGRSDAILYVTLNPREKSMYILSIQRDIRVPLKGVGARDGTPDKINHAYAYGGVTGSVETVENFLNLPVDYYIAINMEGFSDLVDFLGGITVENPIEWTDPTTGVTFEKGTLELKNGAQALAYVRMRYLDPQGDVGRNARQRVVIKAILEKASRPEMILKLDEFLNIAKKNIKTNLRYEDMQRLIRDYRICLENIQELAFDLESLPINGISYQKVKPESFERITAILREHLEISGETNAEER
ncbi:MAG: LCP family protein [Brockia lithotrophica]|nr:LCP family protein [Brockia lithotrophica]